MTDPEQQTPSEPAPAESVAEMTELHAALAREREQREALAAELTALRVLADATAAPALAETLGAAADALEAAETRLRDEQARTAQRFSEIEEKIVALEEALAVLRREVAERPATPEPDHDADARLAERLQPRVQETLASALAAQLKAMRAELVEHIAERVAALPTAGPAPVDAGPDRPEEADALPATAQTTLAEKTRSWFTRHVGGPSATEPPAGSATLPEPAPDTGHEPQQPAPEPASAGVTAAQADALREILREADLLDDETWQEWSEYARHPCQLARWLVGDYLPEKVPTAALARVDDWLKDISSDEVRLVIAREGDSIELQAHKIVGDHRADGGALHVVHFMKRAGVRCQGRAGRKAEVIRQL
jgi:hypothetical protein